MLSRLCKGLGPQRFELLASDIGSVCSWLEFGLAQGRNVGRVCACGAVMVWLARGIGFGTCLDWCEAVRI